MLRLLAFYNFKFKNKGLYLEQKKFQCYQRCFSWKYRRNDNVLNRIYYKASSLRILSRWHKAKLDLVRKLLFVIRFEKIWINSKRGINNWVLRINFKIKNSYKWYTRTNYGRISELSNKASDNVGEKYQEIEGIKFWWKF